MFTGLIQYVGTIVSKTLSGDGIQFGIDCGNLTRKLSIGDSIAINGVCLTVTKKKKQIVEVHAVKETLKKTVLNNFKISNEINCELPLRAIDYVGGHFVLGHVDTVGKIISIRNQQESNLFKIWFPKRFSKYVIPRGSIAVDGVSLTIAELQTRSFIVSIIPHTFGHTIFKNYTTGENVNIEFDVLGKYAFRNKN